MISAPEPLKNSETRGKTGDKRIMTKSAKK